MARSHVPNSQAQPSGAGSTPAAALEAPFNLLKASLAIFLLYMLLTAAGAAALAPFGNTLHPYTRLFIFAVTVAVVGYRHMRRHRCYPAARYLVWTLGLVMLYMACMATALFLRNDAQPVTTFLGGMLLQTVVFMLSGLIAFGLAERIFRIADRGA